MKPTLFLLAAGMGSRYQVLIRGTFLEGLTLAIRDYVVYFVKLRIAKVKPSRKVPLISTW